MLYDLNDIIEANDFKIKSRELVEQRRQVELIVKQNNRTIQQNKALHKFFLIICERLNEMGMEFNYTGLKGFNLSTRYTPIIVKEFFWRPIQITMFDIDSTTKINTIQINEIMDVLIKWFGEKGVVIQFPSKEQLNKLIK